MKRCNLQSSAVVLTVCLTFATGSAVAQCALGNENTWVPTSTPIDEFVDLGDGMLFHERTRLIWLRCPLGQTWDGSACAGSPDLMNWSAALLAADAHQQLEADDWRLPNRNELASIVEVRCFSPAVNNAVFPGTTPAGFWTSSPLDGSIDQRWRLDFADGELEPADETQLNAVRLVRAGWP